MNATLWASLAADGLLVLSAGWNAAHFSLVRIRTPRRALARRFAAMALVLLNGGLAVRAGYLLATGFASMMERDLPHDGIAPLAVRAPALAGALLVTALVLRDRRSNGGDR